MDEVSLATLKVVRSISAGRGERLMSHTVASHGDGVASVLGRVRLLKLSRGK